MKRLRKFQRQPHSRGRGQVAEDQAVKWLERQGYRIEERNVHTAAGEIDAIGWDGDTLCFIEIKARGTALYGSAIDAVTPSKRRRLTRAASLYLARRRTRDTPCRFDVLGLDRSSRDPEDWSYSLIKNAFSVDG